MTAIDKALHNSVCDLIVSMAVNEAQSIMFDSHDRTITFRELNERMEAKIKAKLRSEIDQTYQRGLEDGKL